MEKQLIESLSAKLWRMERDAAFLERKLAENGLTYDATFRIRADAEAAVAELVIAERPVEQEPPQVVRSGAGLGDAVAGVVAERDELRATIQEMLATLRVNLLRGTLRTDDDAFFERLLNKWSGWSAASPNAELSGSARENPKI